MRVFMFQGGLKGDALALYLAMAASFSGSGEAGYSAGTEFGIPAKLLGMDAERFEAAFSELKAGGFVEVFNDGGGWRLPWFEDFEDQVVEFGNRGYWRKAKRRSREVGKDAA